MSERLAIRTVMHPAPHSVGAEQSLQTAIDLMKQHNSRHLPVRSLKSLVGILTDRDIQFALRVDKKDAETIQVKDACTMEPYVVTPETPVAKVALTMAHEHLGCALVVENNELIGIFTTVDACRVLSEVLSGRREQ